MISTDRKMFDTGSVVHARMLSYAELFDELHIIVFAKKTLGFTEMSVGGKLFLYSTQSRTKFGYISDAVRLGKRLLSASSKNYQLSTKDWIVSTQDPFETGLVGVRLSRLFNTKLQIQIHTDFLSPYFTKGSLLNRIRLFIALSVINKASRIRVVSERIARGVVDRFPHKKEQVDVLPIYVENNGQNGVTNGLRQKYAHFSFIALAVGRLEYEKNVKEALYIWKEVVGRYPNAGLIVVGTGREEKKLLDLAKTLGISKNVVFEGEQKMIGPYYQSADILLSTSLYEGYGMVFVEAAMAGLLVVAHDVGVVSEVFKDGINAMICEVQDRQCMVAKIASLIDQPELYKRLKDSVPESIQSHLYPSKQAYLDAYQKVVEMSIR